MRRKMRFSNKVLSIGCHCNPPKGGIAYVLKAYQNNIYSPFKFVANSKGNFFANIWYLIKAYIHCEWLYLTDKDIEIVHIHTASYISFRRSTLFVHQAKRHHKKVIIHIHGGGFKDFYHKTPKYVEKELHKTDAVVALSETWKNFFLGIGCNKVFVINNIIEPPVFFPANSDGKFHFLFLGLITEAKGIFDLLEVAEQNLNVWKDKVIFHIGGRGKVEKLTSSIASKGLSDIVHYEGWVSGKKKQELLNRANAFILPSYTEGIPISILEAMSYGLPIISTQVGGIPDMIQEESNGYLFVAGDLQAMTQSINRVVNLSTLDYESISTANKEFAKNCLPEMISEKLEKIYDEILS